MKIKIHKPINKGGVLIVGNYHESCHEASRILSPNGVAPTIKENHGTVTAVVEMKPRNRDVILIDFYHHSVKRTDVCGTITTSLTVGQCGVFCIVED